MTRQNSERFSRSQGNRIRIRMLCEPLPIAFIESGCNWYSIHCSQAMQTALYLLVETTKYLRFVVLFCSRTIWTVNAASFWMLIVSLYTVTLDFFYVEKKSSVFRYLFALKHYSCDWFNYNNCISIWGNHFMSFMLFVMIIAVRVLWGFSRWLDLHAVWSIQETESFRSIQVKKKINRDKLLLV